MNEHTTKCCRQILIIDVETTGFDPTRNACIEIGAVLLDELLNPADEFSSLIAPWPGAEISPESLAVSGISVDQLRSAQTVDAVISRFDAWLKRVQPPPLLAGWNVWFDAAFLRSLYQRANIRWPFSHRLFDVQSVFAFFSNMDGASQSQAIAQVFGETQSHRALGDAQHTARLLAYLSARRHDAVLGHVAV